MRYQTHIRWIRARRVALCAAVSACLLAFAPSIIRADGPSESRLPEIHLLDVEQHDELLPGTTRPRRTVTVGASFDGRVMEILVEEGDRVREGEPIAKLDDRVVRASRELARVEANHHARIDRARVQLRRNKRILQRTREARERNGANKEDVDDARSNVALARADLADAIEQREAARRRRVEASKRLEQHTIRAPFEGVVVRLSSEEGAVLRTGDPIADLADVDRIAVELYLPASSALAVEHGELYALSLDAPIGRVLGARARYVEPRIDPTSNTMRVVFDLDVPAGSIPSGVLVRPASRAPSRDETAYIAGLEPIQVMQR